MIIQAAAPCHSLLPRSFLFSLAVVGVIMNGFSVEAAGPNVPWECSNYTDEAQTRCLQAFIEHQQEQIGQLEGRLQAQEDLVGRLKGQVDRQTASAAQLQQQLSQPPVSPMVAPPPYVYPYSYAYPAYPPVGIGLYLGRPWGVPGFYGYYGRPYGGPWFFYRHHGRHW
jgi:hypothetical protein